MSDWDDKHDCEIEEDMDGWVWVECSCGFRAGPMPGKVEAIDEIGDHREAAAALEVQP